MTQFCDTHHGNWPETSHTVTADPITGKFTLAWIYTIAPYMEDVDAIRICPSDQIADLRLRGKGTSYSMNGYLSKESLPAFENRRKLVAMSQSVVVFELAENKDIGAIRTQNPGDIDPYNDHVHSFNWFASSNVRKSLVFAAISADVEVERHNTSTHFLYADGHVELISSEQIEKWATDQFNFARPPS